VLGVKHETINRGMRGTNVPTHDKTDSKIKDSFGVVGTFVPPELSGEEADQPDAEWQEWPPSS
jgi:hypothetical protein